jgi:hypothetical protein
MDREFIATIAAAAITAAATITAAWINARRSISARLRSTRNRNTAASQHRHDTPSPKAPYAIACIAIGQTAIAYVSFARLPLTAGVVGLCIEAGVFILIGFWLVLRD